MNRLFRCANVLVLCSVVLCLLGLHANVGQAGVIRIAAPVTAHWEPGTEAWLKLPRNAPQYADLFDLKPAHPLQSYELSIFKVLLPPRYDTAVGKVWTLDARQMLPFLRQFHPGATVSLSGQQGAYACLRAVSPNYYEIVFQFHADFDLEITEKIEKVEEHLVAVKRQFDEIEKDFASLQEARDESLSAVQANVEKELVDKLEEQIGKLNPADDLAILKKELAETVVALTEVTTSLETLSGDLETRLNELKTTITALEELLSNFDARLDALEKALTAHFDAKLNEVEKRLAQNLDSRLDELEQALTAKFDAEFSTLQKMLTAQERTLTQRLNTLLTAEMAKLKGLQAYNEGIYLMPKEFKGRLLISSKLKHPLTRGAAKPIIVEGEMVAFTIACPAEDGNAILFVFGDEETVSMPRMELIAGDFDKHNITWTNAITAEQADEALRSKFAARKSRR